MQTNATETLYEKLGGEATIRRLVEAFYPRVYRDPDLAPLFPDGMEEIMEKQRMFLTQFTGGPALYSQRYGPPRMRDRHLAFEITPQRAQAWLRCMREAMDEIGLSGAEREKFYEQLTEVAQVMVNTPDGLEKKSLPGLSEFSEERFTMHTVHRMGNSVTLLLGFLPGQELPAHRHTGAVVYVLVLEGEGTITVDGKTEHVTREDSICVDGDQSFSFRNTGSGPARLYVMVAK